MWRWNSSNRNVPYIYVCLVKWLFSLKVSSWVSQRVQRTLNKKPTHIYAVLEMCTCTHLEWPLDSRPSNSSPTHPHNKPYHSQFVHYQAIVGFLQRVTQTNARACTKITVLQFAFYQVICCVLHMWRAWPQTQTQYHSFSVNDSLRGIQYTTVYTRTKLHITRISALWSWNVCDRLYKFCPTNVYETVMPPWIFFMDCGDLPKIQDLPFSTLNRANQFPNRTLPWQMHTPGFYDKINK